MIAVEFNLSAVLGNVQEQAYAAMRTHYKPLGWAYAANDVLKHEAGGYESILKWEDVWWVIWPKRDNVAYIGPRGSLPGGVRTFTERLEHFIGPKDFADEIEGWLRLFGRMRNEDHDWS